MTWSWLFVLPLLAGAAAIYLLLPRPRAYPALWGALLGAVALGLAGWLIVGLGFLTPESFLFYVFSAAAVGFGGLLVTQRNPARAALAFALVVLSTCGLFLLLAAPFLMAATIIIYAGAVIVTFLFVLMLAQQEGPSDADARSREPLLATAIGFVLLGALLYVLQVQWSYEAGGDGKDLDDVLQRIRQGDKANVLQPLRDALADKEKKLQEAQSVSERDRLQAETESLRALQGRIEDDLAAGPPEDESAQDSKRLLKELELAVLQAKQRHGWPQPAKSDALSVFSGPPPNLPADQARTEDGKPPMPADNPGYLGKSLFTDYLLPVELGGFLLLVAAIGAIAIAQRHSGAPALRAPGDSRSDSPTYGQPEAP